MTGLIVPSVLRRSLQTAAKNRIAKAVIVNVLMVPMLMVVTFGYIDKIEMRTVAFDRWILVAKGRSKVNIYCVET